MVKPIAAQPRRSASLTPAVTAWSLLVARLFELLHFRMVGICAGERVGAGGDHAERGGVGVQPGLDRELVVVVRIIGRRVGREAARGSVLEALIDRQDHDLAGAAELAGGQDAGEVRLHAGRVALVPVQDLLHFLSDAHVDGPPC